jgi:hypothetical protein
MSKKSVLILIYHCHELLDLIVVVFNSLSPAPPAFSVWGVSLQHLNVCCFCYHEVSACAVYQHMTVVILTKLKEIFFLLCLYISKKKFSDKLRWVRLHYIPHHVTFV